MTCRERLEAYFRENHVPFQVTWHPIAYTAQEVAAAEHVSGYLVAKPVMAWAGDQMVMVVLTAPQRLDLAKLQQATGKPTRLAEEAEFAPAFPDCEVGAQPPFGNLYGIPVYADRALEADPEIVFRCGSHRETMRIPYTDFKRLVQPTIGDFAQT
ncbi:MAG: YbaK/EbsC family protein [Armatimonadota bacterium]|nr:YbaK/EbsC family protein [Armatimonadota bacterium]MDR5696904.1 YbaK/EbsC family protein [Armatimonadota bacterium]